MTVAAPKRIGDDFSDAPPGHRFGLYFNGWSSSWELEKTSKTEALKKIVSIVTADLPFNRSLLVWLRNA